MNRYIKQLWKMSELNTIVTNIFFLKNIVTKETVSIFFFTEQTILLFYIFPLL